MTPVEIARAQIGKPWRHQARGPDKLDCIGLLVVSFADYGLKDITTYGRDPHDGLLEKHLDQQFGKPVSDMRVGDVVAIAFPRIIRHVGIVGDYLHGGLSLIHTNGSVGLVTEHRLDERWIKRIKRVYRLGEVA